MNYASCAVVFIIVVSGTARAQSTQPDTGPDNPSEWYSLRQDCSEMKKIAGCGQELFTGDPAHVAVGSIAPQNGFGLGPAYVGHKTTETWRITWNADAIESFNTSWRAGGYMQLVHTPSERTGVSFGPPPSSTSNLTTLPEHSVIGLYGQRITLNELTYFGLGPGTTTAGHSLYGMTESILGANVVKPLGGPLKSAFYAELNGRFVEIRNSKEAGTPTQALYTEASTPGLTTQPGTLQAGEGLRIRPVMFDDLLRLHYNVTYQQYVAPSNSVFSFQRLTFDLGHQFALYGKTTPLLVPRAGNGPDTCWVDPGSEHPKCTTVSRNREGSINLRLLSVFSMTQGSNVVPFYFQPTLGGSDINGNAALSAYQDYRFRAPDLLLTQESFEHSIADLPVGVLLMAEQGTLALTRSGLGSSPWVHSLSAGVTVRAGGFPAMTLLFSWGGNEGTHTIANVNTSLLGGSARPSLF